MCYAGPLRLTRLYSRLDIHFMGTAEAGGLAEHRTIDP